MPSSRTQRRARIAGVVSAALAFTGFQLLLPQAAQANPAGTAVVISEVYLNGGSTGATYTNRFFELYNPTASAISLSGKSIQYRAATSTGNSTSTVALVGSVPSHGYFLFQGASNGSAGGALPAPDQSSTSFNPSGSAGGTVSLINGTSPADPSSSPLLIDKISYGTGNTPEGNPAGGGPSGYGLTKSLSRNGSNADTDNNLNDFTAVTPTPMNTSSGAAALSLTNPGAQSTTVGSTISTLQLQASGGSGTYTYSATGLPSGLDLNTSNGQITGTPDTVNDYNVHATVDDGSATASQDFVWHVTAVAAPTPIKDIQGTGDTSPFAGQTKTTEGKVTASYPTGGLNGFYIQSTTSDDPNASDAIFVFGNGTFSAFPTVGDSVRVTGVVSEFSGLTEMTVSNNSAVSTIADLGTVPVKTTIPGTDCALPGTACLSGSALNAAREQVEGEAFQPTDPWTLTDVYDGGPAYNPPSGTNSSSNFGEIGVAADSSTALIAPTELIDAQNTAAIATRVAYNNAHRIIMDDGSSTNYTLAANTGQPFPWMTATSVPRVGAALTFPAPVIFTYGFSAWRIEPSSQVVGAPSATQPQFADTRTGNAAPADVGGQIRLATFNVLNFFPTTGEEYVSSGLGSCSYYNDRNGAHVTVNDCGASGPRGAANDTNLTRQRDKIVAAINTANADIVSLEELENSVKFGKDRDFAIDQLVTALNAASTPGRWAYAPSPAAADLPTLAEQDVIRTGFIYQPANVSLVGASKVLVGSTPFNNAREPLAQAFKRAGDPDSAAFAVIVNHFKSKGSGVDDGTGQGNANPDRIAQADALVSFANQFKTDRGVDKVFLVGDFNAYSHEDPIEHLETGGYTPVDSTDDPNEETYNFDGMLGSLDHVLANAAALPAVTGADVWTINGYESVYYEYSRFNYNATDLYNSGPFRSSDHSPEIVGLNVGPTEAVATVDAGDVTVEYGKVARVITSVTGSSGAPTGSVEVFDGSTSLGTALIKSNGKATVQLDLTGYVPGSYPLTAVYSGDGSYASGSDSLTLVITKATSTVTAPAASGAYGKAIPVKVTIAGPKGVVPSGTVTLSEGGTEVGTATVSSKVTTVSIPASAGLTPGVHTLDVAYSGDGNLTSGATTVQVTVSKAPAVITATATPKRPKAGGDVNLDVTVSGAGAPATGDVQVSVDGVALTTVTLVGGAATADLGSFAAGGHTVTVDYLGSDTLATGSKTIVLNVRP